MKTAQPQDSTYFDRLAARIRSRDAQAEEELAQVFSGRVRSFVIANSRDEFLAAELAQDVPAAVVRTMRGPQAPAGNDLPGLMLEISRKLLNERQRYKAKTRKDPSEPEETPVATESSDSGSAARRAVAALEPNQQSILMLSLVDDTPPEEIAGRLKLTEQAVLEQKALAIQKVAEALQS